MTESEPKKPMERALVALEEYLAGLEAFTKATGQLRDYVVTRTEALQAHGVKTDSEAANLPGNEMVLHVQTYNEGTLEGYRLSAGVQRERARAVQSMTLPKELVDNKRIGYQVDAHMVVAEAMQHNSRGMAKWLREDVSLYNDLKKEKKTDK